MLIFKDMKNFMRLKILSMFLLGFLLGWDGLAQQAAKELGQWTLIESNTQPTSRHENAYVAVGDKLYLIGGRGGKPVDVYDTQTNEWSNLPGPPLEMHHFQAVEYGGKIYVVGAFTGGYPNETPIAHVYIFDPQTGEWTQGPEIPQNRRRGSAGAVVHGDKIYVVCGIINGHVSDQVAWLDEFDPNTGEWKQLADAPHARDHFHAAAFRGKIYAVAGRLTSSDNVFGNTVPEVDVYDIGTGKWTTLADPIPTPRAGNTVAVLGKELLVIGGESMKHMEAHSETESLDLQDYSWHTLSPLVEGRHGTQAAVHNGKLYMACGSNTRGANEITSHEVFDPGREMVAFDESVKAIYLINGQENLGVLSNDQVINYTVRDFSGLVFRPDLTGQAGSVVFELDGEQTILNEPPFDFPAHDLASGQHHLVVIPYENADAQGAEGGSMSRSFVIETTTKSRQYFIEESFKAYPNPFEGEVNFEVKVQRKGLVKVSIFDLNGLAVEEVANKTLLPEQVYRFIWKPQTPAGLYVVRLETEDEVLQKKIVFQR
jgi:N-acetylneuraminic acid mutarotase